MHYTSITAHNYTQLIEQPQQPPDLALSPVKVKREYQFLKIPVGDNRNTVVV
jgi:hypothetical protein